MGSGEEVSDCFNSLYIPLYFSDEMVACLELAFMNEWKLNQMSAFERVAEHNETLDRY